MFDDGISDSMCRVLTNTRVTTGRLVSDSEALIVPPGMTPEDAELAQANVDSCVIGLQDRWKDTLEIVNHWFPWIHTKRDPDRRKMDIYSGKETMANLKESARQHILDLNQCDLAVYERMVLRFEKQLAAIRASGFVNR